MARRVGVRPSDDLREVPVTSTARMPPHPPTSSPTPQGLEGLTEWHETRQESVPALDLVPRPRPAPNPGPPQ